VRFFVNSALKIQCHIVKNALLQTAFSAILPIGNYNFSFSDDYNNVIRTYSYDSTQKIPLLRNALQILQGKGLLVYIEVCVCLYICYWMCVRGRDKDFFYSEPLFLSRQPSISNKKLGPLDIYLAP